MKKLLFLFIIITSSISAQIINYGGGRVTASLGSSITITDQTPISLRPTLPSQCTEYLWTTTGTGTFADSTAKNTTYTPSYTDYLRDSIVLSIMVKCSIGDSAIIYAKKVLYPSYLELETRHYLSDLTTSISDSTIQNINNFNRKLKYYWNVDSLAEKLDYLQIYGNETEELAKRDLIHSYNATSINNPVFTAFEGFQFDSLTNYLNSGYNPYANGVKYTLNNASLSVFSRTNRTITEAEIGARTSTADYTVIVFKTPTNGGIASWRMHSGTGSSINGIPINSLGLATVARSANNDAGLFGYHNGTSLAKTNGASLTSNVPNLNLFVGARNYNGVPEIISKKQITASCAGGYLTQTEHYFLYECLEEFLNHYGKDVTTLFPTIISETDDYIIKYSTYNIAEVRHGYKLSYNVTTGKILLKYQDGTEYFGELPSGFNEMTMAYIFANGNVIFADVNKLYASYNKLQTITEIHALNIDGNPYIPKTGTSYSYQQINTYKTTYIDGKELLVWGNYGNVYDSCETNIFYTSDLGHTVKIAYKFGAYSGTLGDPENDVITRHVHQIALKDSLILICTGDSPYTHILKGVYNSVNDNITIEKLYTGNDYHFASFTINEDTVYVSKEGPVSEPYSGFLFKTTIDSIGFTSAWDTIYTDNNKPMGTYFMDDETGQLVSVYNSLVTPLTILYSKDYGINFGTIDLSTLSNQYTTKANSKDSDGYYTISVRKLVNGQRAFGGGTLYVKIK